MRKEFQDAGEIRGQSVLFVISQVQLGEIGNVVDELRADAHQLLSFTAAASVGKPLTDRSAVLSKLLAFWVTIGLYNAWTKRILLLYVELFRCINRLGFVHR
ncbi:uncharacterized protein METZ01_LOCUS51778 [marine metagenome]|uniref:Uncharacterized protein n=1 Tax=marine metagenome TaxID=408172 RepID=A0A381S635_9ZZZZ